MRSKSEDLDFAGFIAIWLYVSSKYLQYIARNLL